jgi:hypothetical protein
MAAGDVHAERGLLANAPADERPHTLQENWTMNKRSIFAAVAAVAVMATAAYAIVTFDPQTGAGFVGKGDVQLVYGWNNKALQDNAGSVQFRATSTVVTERSWVCTNDNNQTTQERERTTTTSIQGVLDEIARVKNQITGFNLTGYDGTPTESPPVTDGPPLNSCPMGPWTLTTPAGDPVPVSSTTVVEVSINGTDWFALQ